MDLMGLVLHFLICCRCLNSVMLKNEVLLPFQLSRRFLHLNVLVENINYDFMYFDIKVTPSIILSQPYFSVVMVFFL